MMKINLIKSIVLLFLASMSVFKTQAQQSDFVSYTSNEILKIDDYHLSLRIHFEIAEGVHIQSYEPEDPDLVSCEIQINTPAQFKIDTILYPLVKDDRVEGMYLIPDIYEGTFMVEIVLHQSDKIIDNPILIEGDIFYQACSMQSCYFPRRTSFSFYTGNIKNRKGLKFACTGKEMPARELVRHK